MEEAWQHSAVRSKALNSIPNKALGISLIIAGVVGFAMALVLLGGSSSGATDSSLPPTNSRSDGTTPTADAFASSTGAYMDSREKQLYERDPSSMGYTEADRDFLQEHGVTESEARAAETILQQHGIE